MMNKKYPTDNALAKAVAANDMDAWEQFVHQYHGRLLNFARSRVGQQADAEDIVQESFISFLKAVQKNPGSQRFENLNNYLFAILRNTIYSHYRTRWAKSVSLLQDAYISSDDPNSQNALGAMPCEDMSVSRCVIQGEQKELLYEALSAALAEILDNYKRSCNFRNLKICDLIFYSRLSYNETASVLGLTEAFLRVFKHRFIKRLHDLSMSRMADQNIMEPLPDDLISEIWEQERFTCPKYSTLGNFMMENVEPEWFEYIDFHLTTFGCHICRASFKDLQTKQVNNEKTYFEKRILTSTVGFLRK